MDERNDGLSKNKKINKRFFSTIVICVIFFIFLSLLFINNSKNAEFFNITLAQLLTPLTNLFIAIIITFYLGNRKNERRRKKDRLEKLLEDIQKELYEIELDIDKLFENKIIMSKLRRVSNKISSVNRMSPGFPIKKCVKYIDKQFIEYRKNLGERYPLQPQEEELVELVIISNNIISKCDEAIVSLYNE